VSDDADNARGVTRHTVRDPAVAGLFYPASPDRLRAMIRDAVAAATWDSPRQGWPRPVPKAIIGPHAGYLYSGSVAASAYARVAPGRGTIEKVVLIGPAHRVALDTVAASSADTFATPLGELTVDGDGRRAVLSCPGVTVNDDAHAGEHSLEVHLPFIQVVLGDVLVLPLVVGEVPAQVVADALEAVWGGPETLVVASTDLSHYYDHATASVLDAETAAAIVACRPGEVGPDGACGVFAVRGLLTAARRHHLAAEKVDLRSSGDTAGNRDRVVGYGAFVLA